MAEQIDQSWTNGWTGSGLAVREGGTFAKRRGDSRREVVTERNFKDINLILNNSIKFQIRILSHN